MIKFEKRSKYAVYFYEKQIGYMVYRDKPVRCLIEADSFDYEWAKKEGLSLAEHELLCRIETIATEVHANGFISGAHIVKINLKTGSIAFTKGEEGQEGFGWDRYVRANAVVYD